MRDGLWVSKDWARAGPDRGGDPWQARDHRSAPV